MKNQLRRFTLLLLTTSGLSAAPLQAQNGTPQPQPPSGRDPFHKERGAPTTVPSFSENIVSVTLIFESYWLKQEDAVGLLSSPPDSAARYQRVKELVAGGGARLEDIRAVAGKPGQRTLIESVDEIQTPTQFLPPTAEEEPALPSGYLQLQYGDRLEVEPILGADGRACNLSFSISTKRLLGFGQFRAGNRAQPQPSPTRENREIVTSVSLPVGEPTLLGTRSQAPSAAAEAPEIGVVFGRVLVRNERPEGAQPPTGPVGYAEHLLSIYSVERAAARAILEADIKPGASFQAVQALLQKKQAKFEHMVSLPVQNGMRAQSDENIISQEPGGVAVYPDPKSREATKAVTESAPGKPAAPGRVSYFPKMTGKNFGLSIEVETAIGPADAMVKGLPMQADLNLLILWRADVGILKGPAAVALYPETTVAESRRLETAISCYTGVPTLLGTLNLPGDDGVNGRKDSGRVWLAFMQVTPVKP